MSSPGDAKECQIMRLEAMNGMLPEGGWKGQLELTPSRDVARGSRMLSEYYGKTLVWPIEVNVRTVSGKWSDEAQCPPAHPVGD
jgi:hypothetical protein